MPKTIKIIMSSGREYLVPVTNYLKKDETSNTTEMLSKVLGGTIGIGAFTQISDINGKVVSISLTNVSSIEWPS